MVALGMPRAVPSGAAGGHGLQEPLRPASTSSQIKCSHRAGRERPGAWPKAPPVFPWRGDAYRAALACVDAYTRYKTCKAKLREANCALPPTELLERADEVVDPLFQRSIACALECRTLAS